jgi:protein-S-isoprenylcysteine O-methyltransferase Ste14
MAVLSPSLQVTSEFADDDARRVAARERFADFGARASICALFVFFATQIGGEFARTGHVTGLLLLVSELLVVLLTVVRRPAVVVDRAMSTRLVAAVSMIGIYFIRPVGTPLAPDLATATVSGAGLLAIIAAKLTLGRSFGLMPANRGIVRRGIYRVVRHPIYAGYLVTHVAFLIAHPTMWNCALIFTSDAALLVRAVFEERTLARDAEYADYMQQVRWRVLPGCF